MASRKYQSRRGRKTSSRRRSNGSRNKKSRKWHQKGCQSGGGSMTGGWPWGASDVHPSGGSGLTGTPSSINGNHYAFNSSNPMAPPQNSNHLVEKGMFGGRRKSSRVRDRGRGRGRSRKHRKFIGEQRGGMAQYMPEVVNPAIRGTLGIPSSLSNTLQGASTGYRSADPTIQPIGQQIQLS